MQAFQKPRAHLLAGTARRLRVGGASLIDRKGVGILARFPFRESGGGESKETESEQDIFKFHYGVLSGWFFRS
jgi:hypothetical protein